MKSNPQRPERSASQDRKQPTKPASTLFPAVSNKSAVSKENSRGKLFPQTAINSPTLQKGKGNLMLNISQGNSEASLLRSPFRYNDTSLKKTPQNQPNELIIESLLLVKSVNYKAYNVSLKGHLPTLPTEERDLNSSTARDADASIEMIRQPSENCDEGRPLITDPAVWRKNSEPNPTIELNSRPLNKQKPSEPMSKAKFKRTVKEVAAIATKPDEEVLTSRSCKKLKSLRTTSESIARRNPIELGLSRQQSHTRTEASRNYTINSLTQVVTPQDSSTNVIKKTYYQIKKEANSLTIPLVMQRKEKLAITRGREERREKMILKDKLPKFGLRVDQRPQSSMPSTNTNKTVQSETSSGKKAIFIARSPPSKLLLNSKTTTIVQLRITKQSAGDSGAKSPNTGSTNNLLLAAPSENSQSARNLLNLNTRTRSPIIQGLDTSQSGKRVKMELAPEERERRRLQYVAPTASNKHKYYVGEGNNAELVKRVLNAREQWEEIESFSSLFNLKWQQSCYGYKYERLTGEQNPKQLVNHFEFHKEISTKNGLIKNLSHYCARNKIELFNLTPITFTFDMDDEFENDLIAFSHFFRRNCGDPKTFCQNDFAQAKKTPANAFFTFSFRRKGKICHIPETYNGQKKQSAYLQPKLFNTYFKGSNLWLLKPTGLNRGMGIEIFNTLQGLNNYLNEWLDVEAMPTRRKTNNEGSESDSGEEDKNNDKKKKKGPPNAGGVSSRTFVIQKYIESPLLVFNRKFDIRAYAMVTHEMKLYFYREGYLRTSSEEFTIGRNDIDNKFIHLTNDAVQKYSDSYGACEQANKLSYKELQAYLDKNEIPLSVEKQLVPKMRELVEISMSSVGRLLNPNQSKHCFEVFGYDFIIDSEFNVFLIEVNTNPCLEESSPLLGRLIPRMLHDAFKLTVDTLFPLRNEKPVRIKTDKENVSNPESTSEVSTAASNKEEITPIVKDLRTKMNAEFKLDDYADDQNLWEFLCVLDTSKGFSRRAR